MAGTEPDISRIVIRRVSTGFTGDEYKQTADGKWWRPYEPGDENLTGCTVAILR